MLTPRDYQITGIEWLRQVRRGLLTDHPGLGKTLMSAEAAETPCLVTAPKHLLAQWADFLREQYPNDIVSMADGARKSRDKALDVKADWWVINHAMLRSYDMPTDIKTIIVDESHHFRNRNAEQSRALKALANRDKNVRVYMLSASPMWKSLDDIWMQLHILYPQVFTSYHRFVEMFFVTVDNPYTTKVVAVKKKMKKVLEDTLSPIKMGRSYKDVGRMLPDRIDNVVKVELEKEVREFYNKVLEDCRFQYQEDGKAQNLIFRMPGIIHALRQITFTKPKVEAIKGLIEDNPKPTLIGVWYKDHAREVHAAIPNSVLVTGDMPGRERRELALKAQRRGWHVIASEASLTEGVNLHAYRQVIMAECHYAPAANYQFVSRVIRDRNDNGLDVDPVIVHHVMARKTIDEVIYNVAVKRQGSIREIIQEALV